jgi:Fe-S cluster assembly iron-binding protein IscA
METNAMIRIRSIGERFAAPVHGELVVVEQTGCAGCAYNAETCADLDSDRRRIAGTCALREVGGSVIFAKVKDYAVFKLTGEWP